MTYVMSEVPDSGELAVARSENLVRMRVWTMERTSSSTSWGWTLALVRNSVGPRRSLAISDSEISRPE